MNQFRWQRSKCGQFIELSVNDLVLYKIHRQFVTGAFVVETRKGDRIDEGCPRAFSILQDAIDALEDDIEKFCSQWHPMSFDRSAIASVIRYARRTYLEGDASMNTTEDKVIETLKWEFDPKSGVLSLRSSDVTYYVKRDPKTTLFVKVKEGGEGVRIDEDIAFRSVRTAVQNVENCITGSFNTFYYYFDRENIEEYLNRDWDVKTGTSMKKEEHTTVRKILLSRYHYVKGVSKLDGKTYYAGTAGLDPNKEWRTNVFLAADIKSLKKQFRKGCFSKVTVVHVNRMQKKRFRISYHYVDVHTQALRVLIVWDRTRAQWSVTVMDDFNNPTYHETLESARCMAHDSFGFMQELQVIE
jgi:hypothetical protein